MATPTLGTATGTAGTAMTAGDICGTPRNGTRGDTAGGTTAGDIGGGTTTGDIEGGTGVSAAFVTCPNPSVATELAR
ncbi:hypothetical protein TURU_000684 [Turdus rufiventris]|nr:hypothetical protein TURU_000684 [Turdus rufiventris]